MNILFPLIDESSLSNDSCINVNLRLLNVTRGLAVKHGVFIIILRKDVHHCVGGLKRST